MLNHCTYIGNLEVVTSMIELTVLRSPDLMWVFFGVSSFASGSVLSVSFSSIFELTHLSLGEWPFNVTVAFWRLAGEFSLSVLCSLLNGFMQLSLHLQELEQPLPLEKQPQRFVSHFVRQWHFLDALRVSFPIELESIVICSESEVLWSPMLVVLLSFLTFDVLSDFYLWNRETALSNNSKINLNQ